MLPLRYVVLRVCPGLSLAILDELFLSVVLRTTSFLKFAVNNSYFTRNCSNTMPHEVRLTLITPALASTMNVIWVSNSTIS